MDTNTIRRIAHETGMFGPEFNVTGEQCDKFASALISATVDSVARTWDGCMVPMFDPAGNTTGVIDIGATIRADGVLSAAGLVDSLPDMQGEPVDRLANLQAAVLSEVVKWALAGHIGEMGVTVEAGRAIRAVTSGVRGKS